MFEEHQEPKSSVLHPSSGSINAQSFDNSIVGLNSNLLGDSLLNDSMFEEHQEPKSSVLHPSSGSIVADAAVDC